MDALRRILAMAVLASYRTYKSPIEIMATLLAPIVLGLWFSGQLANAPDILVPQVTVANEDQGEAAATFIMALEETPFDVRVVDRSTANHDLVNGTTGLTLVIPEGFEEMIRQGVPRVEILHSHDYSTDEHEARVLAIAQAMATGSPIPGPVIVHELPRDTLTHTDYGRLRAAFGLYLLFAFRTIVARADSLRRERETGHLKRTLGAGATYSEVIAAHILNAAMTATVQAVIILGITSRLGLPWLIAGGFHIMVTVSSTILALLGIAVAVVAAARSPEQVRLIKLGVPLLMFYTGGILWPTDLGPSSMKVLGMLNPFYWSIEALSRGLIYVSPTVQILPVAVLLSMGLVGALMGICRFQRMEP